MSFKEMRLCIKWRVFGAFCPFTFSVTCADAAFGKSGEKNVNAAPLTSVLVAVHVWGWQKAASEAAAQTLVLNLGQSDTIRFVRLSSFSMCFLFIRRGRMWTLLSEIRVFVREKAQCVGLSVSLRVYVGIVMYDVLFVRPEKYVSNIDC